MRSVIWILLGNVGALTAQLDRWSRDRSPEGVPPSGTETGTSLLVGGTLGYVPALVALAVTGVVAAIVAGTADYGL